MDNLLSAKENEMLPTAIKVILLVSLTLNMLMAMAVYEYRADYGTLLAWACEAGNGGHECGEE
jgi:hypothetical protein